MNVSNMTRPTPMDTPAATPEFRHYVENQEEYVSKYGGQVVVMKGTEVLAAFADLGSAYWYCQEKDWLGRVFIQQVGPGRESYSTIVYSWQLAETGV